MTLAELESVTGRPGEYKAVVRIAPRYVNANCTVCGDCVKVCPAERSDDFNYGLSKTKAAYLPYGMAFPSCYAIERKTCAEGCRACVDACRYQAIDLDQQMERKTLEVSAIVAATGWAPYDARKIDNLGFGKYPNVITNVIMERMAAANGPTGGKILRPSDGKPPETVAFVQCAGSRDENHLPYCSAVCCSASLKHATYVRAALPDSRVTIFYIDIRTPGRLEDFYAKVATDSKLELLKGKAAKVEQETSSNDLLITAEDVMSGKKITRRFNLLVLATGIVPQTAGLPDGFSRDEYSFLRDSNREGGLYAAGCVKRPEEVSAAVQDATGAALKALGCAVRSSQHA